MNHYETSGESNPLIHLGWFCVMFWFTYVCMLSEKFMKLHRHISIFLTFCFWVFLGHNLIPHHHHSEQVSVPVSEECPMDHGDSLKHQHDADHSPLHCHAFNDVVFDKCNSFQIRKAIPNNLSLEYTLSMMVVAPEHWGISSGYIHLIIPDKPPEDIGARPLRAPPVKA